MKDKRTKVTLPPIASERDDRAFITLAIPRGDGTFEPLGEYLGRMERRMMRVLLAAIRQQQGRHEGPPGWVSAPPPEPPEES